LEAAAKEIKRKRDGVEEDEEVDQDQNQQTDKDESEDKPSGKFAFIAKSSTLIFCLFFFQINQENPFLEGLHLLWLRLLPLRRRKTSVL
jgi:hypothetical protein